MLCSDVLFFGGKFSKHRQSTYCPCRKKKREINEVICCVLAVWRRWDTPIHVDAASGGFIAPFLYPELEWDFRLPLVKSINVSGHKYGLVYAGIGWVIWRSKEDLPEELIFHINYLGADQPTFTLNFSKGESKSHRQFSFERKRSFLLFWQ